MEDLIERTFAPAEGPSGLIVYVGQRIECVGPYPRLAPISPCPVPDLGAEKRGLLII